MRRKTLIQWKLPFHRWPLARQTKTTSYLGDSVVTRMFACGFGALAGFYLLYRFECGTGKFEKSTVDFTKAEEWFDIKTLVSLHNFQESQFKGIKDTTYAEYVKSILTVLGLPTSSQLHLGRKMGAVHCETMELGATLTKTLGNWNPQVFDRHTRQKFLYRQCMVLHSTVKEAAYFIVLERQ
jgi:Centromere DNA-binding protein complex CBF3 subunit, domain 2